MLQPDKLPPEQEQVLCAHFSRLRSALEKAEELVGRWSKPMLLARAVRFVKAELDKEDLKEVGICRQHHNQHLALCVCGPCIHSVTP